MFTTYNMANIFLFSHISCCFSHLNPCEISQQNTISSENIDHIVLGTMPQLMHIAQYEIIRANITS